MPTEAKNVVAGVAFLFLIVATENAHVHLVCGYTYIRSSMAPKQ